MPGADRTQLAQPWRDVWPASDEQAKQPFKGMGFEKDEKIVMDGTSVFPSTATSDNAKAPILAVAK
jgi:hypothetical protein